MAYAMTNLIASNIWESCCEQIFHGLNTAGMCQPKQLSIGTSYICHALWDATTEANSMVFKSLIRPSEEYVCTLWSTPTVTDKSTLESIQRLAACWACGSCCSPLHKCWNKCSDACNTLAYPFIMKKLLKHVYTV